MIGVPVSYNLAFIQTDNVGPMDGEILIALKPGHHPTAGYMHRIRQVLARDFPGSTAYFQPADIVSQVLNFGLSSPIDIQVEFADFGKSFDVARRLRDAVATVPGAADTHIVQVLDYPSLHVAVDRQRAAQVGVSERDVANNLLISLSSSGLVSPSYFLNPQNNVNYFVAVKTPLPQLTSVGSVMATPIVAPSANPGGAAPGDVPEAPTQTLSTVAEIHPGVVPLALNHYTVQRVLDIGASVEGRDLGSVASDIQDKIKALGPLPKGMKITVRGQNQVMNDSFRSLGPRPHPRGAAGLLPHGRAVPIMARPLHHHGGGAGRPRRDPLDARGDAHDAER